MTIQGTLNIGRPGEQGPVEIYVEGDIKVAANGTVVNSSEIPTNMLIFCQGRSVTIGGCKGPSDRTDPAYYHYGFFGGIYAPNADVSIGGGTNLYGSITGFRITVEGNSEVHYDEAMGDVIIGPPTGFTVVRWKELPPE
jgi:hypothetical protein